MQDEFVINNPETNHKTREEMQVASSCPKVGVIILHYNRPELAKACLEALKQQTAPMARVLLVDNGSEDRYGEEIKGLCPKPEILHLGENRGFAGGVNAGIHWLHAHDDVEYIWLLNNDAVCNPEVLENLVLLLSSHPEMGAVSATMEERQGDGSTLSITGGKFSLPVLVPSISKPGEPVDYLCGACLLIRNKAIEQVGLLDDHYFFFFEDVDWCFRARRLGWELGVCEAGGVFHQRSSTIGDMHRLRAGYYRRSYIRFLRHYSKAPVLVAAMTTLYRILSDGLRGRWQACAGTVEGFIQGWRDDQ